MRLDVRRIDHLRLGRSAALGKLAEQRDGFGTGQGVQPVQWFVEDEDFGSVSDCLCKLDALAHAFAEARDFTRGGFAQTHPVNGLPGEALGIRYTGPIDGSMAQKDWAAWAYHVKLYLS